MANIGKVKFQPPSVPVIFILGKEHSIIALPIELIPIAFQGDREVEKSLTAIR